MEVLLNSFHLNGHTLGYHPRTKVQNHLVQHNEQYHIKKLLNSFHLNGHTLVFHDFHPQTFTTRYHNPEILLDNFLLDLNGYKLGFYHSTSTCMHRLSLGVFHEK